MVAPPWPPPLDMPKSASEMMLMPGLVRFRGLRPGLGRFGRFKEIYVFCHRRGTWQIQAGFRV